MVDELSESVLRWAAAALSADATHAAATVIDATVLNWGTSTWLLRVQRADERQQAVLRIAVAGWNGGAQIATGAAALTAAEEHGVPAPRLLAADLDGRVAGVPATLETALPGSSASPPRVSVARLRAAGAALADVHAVGLQPRPHLPLRVRSGEFSDRPRQRRWAALYRASTADEQAQVVAAFGELTGASNSRARTAMTATRSTPLLQLADERLGAVTVPQHEPVLVHGDVWAGNMLWVDETVTLIDWKVAGVGDPGIDLGRLRMKMVLQYGPDAAAHVRAGWQNRAGRSATNLAYWDAMAALHTPADLTDWEPCFDADGNEISAGERTQRRDAFLRTALDGLDDLGDLSTD